MDASLEALIAKHKGHQTNAAASLGVTPRVLNNWIDRGPSGEGKLLTWLALNSPKTLKRWLLRESLTK